MGERGERIEDLVLEGIEGDALFEKGEEKRKERGERRREGKGKEGRKRKRCSVI